MFTNTRLLKVANSRSLSPLSFVPSLQKCEMRWKNFGETTTEEGHKVFFSGKEDKYEHGVGFLVMGCLPVSSRLITIHLRAVPFNITIVQAYTPTSDYDDNKIVKSSITSYRLSLVRHRRRTSLLCKQIGIQSGQEC